MSAQTVGPDDTFSFGLARYQAGAPAEAARIFASLLAREPHNANALRLYGLALVRSGEAKAALPSLALARRLAPTDPLAYLHQGVGLLEAGRPVRAAARLRHAAQLLPNDPAVWINLAAALLAIGQPPAARGAARRAIRAAPAASDAYRALGLAERAAGNLPGARAAFMTAVELAPGAADAWVDLGRVCLQLGRVEDASVAMERALAARPDHAAAEANLAALQIIQGDYEVGKTRLRGLVARHPGSVAARLNLANAMLLDREAEEALALLAGAPPPGREGAHWRAHRALALLLLRRDAAASAEIDAIPKPYGDVEILILWRKTVLAERRGDHTAADAMAAELHALADREGAALLEHRILSHFDLASYQARRGDRGATMDHWIAAHRLLSRVQPFSRDGFAGFVDTSLAAYDAPRLRDGPRAAQIDPTPVFVVGMPRSGTTLVEQILAAHAQVQGAGERAALHRTATRLAGPSLESASVTRLATLGAELLTTTAETYLAELHAEAPGQRYIVDKMPGNALILGFLATLLPGARVILCRRDPRDIGLSIFRMRFFGHHPYAHDLADLGWYLRQHERLMAHWRAVLPIPLLEVELGDWVDDFDATLARVLGFLDLPHDPACARFYDQRRLVRTASAAQVRQPVNAQGIGRWRRFEPYLTPMLDELARQGRPSCPAPGPDSVGRFAGRDERAS